MLNNVTGFDHIYIAVGFTDLRRGIDGLKLIIQQNFSLDPYQNCSSFVNVNVNFSRF